MPRGGGYGGGGLGRRDYATDKSKVYTKQAAQSRFVELIQNGMNINAALEKVDRSRKTYEEWRKNDPHFANKVDVARQLRQIDPTVERGEKLGFAEWRKKYLNTETYWHQLQWVDLIEGREPRELHDSQEYLKGTSRNRILILTPPFHAKSMTLTVDYTVYRLCMNPAYRVLIVSAGSTLATDFLFAIKERLTSPDFADLQRAYAPEGGFEATAESWTDSRIVFGTDVRAAGRQADGKGHHEKDPNVQAVGMGSKVYGKRADLVFIDDGVDETNVSAYQKQQNWLNRTVLSRIEGGGKCIIVGTRISSVDLYSELLKPENYTNGKPTWTHLASPAILEEGETPDQHKTLWPYAAQPWVAKDDEGMLDECLCQDPSCSDGIMLDGQRVYPRWDGKHLEMGPRSDNTPTMWALVYQQKSVSENATFPEHAIRKSTNGARHIGVLDPDRVGHPFGGMKNKYVVAGLDPAIKGFAGIVVMAVDRETQKRYILNAWNMKAPTGDQLKNKMKEVTEEYSVDEWRVEKTGLLQFFTQDSALRLWFTTRGIRFTEHTTGSNKWDPTFGVSSIAPLFGIYDKSWDDQDGEWRIIQEPLIEFPRPNLEGMKALIHQLIIWTPNLDPNKVPCDMVMALWFACVGAVEHLNTGRGVGTITSIASRNKFVSPRAARAASRINLADFRGGL